MKCDFWVESLLAIYKLFGWIGITTYIVMISMIDQHIPKVLQACIQWYRHYEEQANYWGE